MSRRSWVVLGLGLFILGAFSAAKLVAPPSMIRGYQERHGLRVLHAWGMTEMSPLGTTGNLPSSLRDASTDEQLAYRARQGTPLPLVEIRGHGALVMRHQAGDVAFAIADSGDVVH